MARFIPCRKCSVDLVVGDNWYASQAKLPSYICKSCNANYKAEWKNNNPERYNEIHRINSRKFAIKNGEGIYQIMLGNICMYVGEGQLESRKTKHLKHKSSLRCSAVFNYCKKYNIDRSTLSFNVLEHEDDTDIRKEKEDWYITFLNPVINPTPPLGIYV